MGYNKTTDVSAGYISPKHQELLERLKTAHKRTKRAEIEWLIEQEAARTLQEALTK